MSLHLLTAREIRCSFLRGDCSALEIANSFLERIEAKDPSLGSFLLLCKERVLAKARTLDQKKARGEHLGKLAAIPIAVKDNIHMLGERTSCGSRFLTNYIAPFDATVTQLMEEEDALLIGKTNLDEFAMGSSTEHSALQQSNNPWDLDRVPGGSSGGSAAAVAARLVPLALGSDTGGSIRQPASFCGTVGFKPTYGRVSRYGLVAFGSSLDQIGPFANNCGDVALLMEVIGRQCLRDGTSLALPPEEIVPHLDRAALQGKRVGIPWALLEGLEPAIMERFKVSLAPLKAAGATLEEVELDLFRYGLPIYYILSTAELSTNLARFDGVRYGVRSERAKTIDELYDFSKEEGFGKEVKRRILLGTFVLSAGHQEAYYRKAQQVRALMLRRLKEQFEQLDLIAMPVSPTGAFLRGGITDPLQMYLCDVYTVAANLCGVPAISIPSGFDGEGMPLGLQLMAPQKGDRQLLLAAHSYEEQRGAAEQFIPPFVQEAK